MLCPFCIIKGFFETCLVCSLEGTVLSFLRFILWFTNLSRLFWIVSHEQNDSISLQWNLEPYFSHLGVLTVWFWNLVNCTQKSTAQLISLSELCSSFHTQIIFISNYLVFTQRSAPQQTCPLACLPIPAPCLLLLTMLKNTVFYSYLFGWSTTDQNTVNWSGANGTNLENVD